MSHLELELVFRDFLSGLTVQNTFEMEVEMDKKDVLFFVDNILDLLRLVQKFQRF